MTMHELHEVLKANSYTCMLLRNLWMSMCHGKLIRLSIIEL